MVLLIADVRGVLNTQEESISFFFVFFFKIKVTKKGKGTKFSGLVNGQPYT